MGFRINTNTAALAAHANATMNNRALDSSLSKLNSGFRITSAADDASGMAIADSLRSQANALGQAIMNANDAIGVIQTADKAMDEQIKILDTIKTKAIQAAQDTQTTETRRALQADINRLMEQLDNIGNTTSFNGQKLLSGAFSNKEFQIGAYSNETIKASIGATTSDKIGLTRFETGHNIRFDDIVGDADLPSDGKLTLTFKNVDGINDVTLEPVRFADIEAGDPEAEAGSEAAKPKIHIKAGQGLGALVDAINKASDATGIRASANVKSVFAHVISAGSTTDGFAINGVTIGKIAVQDKDANGALRAAINRVKDQTGVEASVDNRGRLVLANRDGRGIQVQDGALPKAPPRDDAAAEAVTPPADAEEAAESIADLAAAHAARPVVMSAGRKPLVNKFDGHAMEVDSASGKFKLAAATAVDPKNNNSLADVAANLKSTNFEKFAAHNAKGAALEVIQNAALAGRSLDDLADFSRAFDSKSLDLAALSFADNTDLKSADLFGADADAVGNLEGIRGAKSLQAMQDEIRAGIKQLDANIKALSAETGTIGGGGAGADVVAQRLAVMIDRRAQLGGFADAVGESAAAWGEKLADNNPPAKGVAVAVNDGKKTFAEKFTFTNGANAVAPAVGAPASGETASAEKVLNKVTAEHVKKAAAKLATTVKAPDPLNNGSSTATDFGNNHTYGDGTQAKMQYGKGGTTITGLDTIFGGTTSHATVKFNDIKADLDGAEIDKYIAANAKKAMVDFISTKLAAAQDGKIAIAKTDLQTSGALEDIGAKIFVATPTTNAYSPVDAATVFADLIGSLSIDELATNLEKVTIADFTKADKAINNTAAQRSDATTNMGLYGAAAMLEGWKAAVAEIKQEAIKQANPDLSAEELASLQGKNLAKAATSLAGTVKAPTVIKDSQGAEASDGTGFGTARKADGSTNNEFKLKYDGKNKVKGLNIMFGANSAATVTYNNVADDLKAGGVLNFITDTAKAAMVDFLSKKLGADGKVTIEAGDFTAGTGALKDVGTAVFSDSAQYQAQPASKYGDLAGKWTLGELMGKIDAVKLDDLVKAEKAIDSSNATAADAKANLGVTSAAAMLEGWKAAVKEVLAEAEKLDFAGTATAGGAGNENAIDGPRSLAGPRSLGIAGAAGTAANSSTRALNTHPSGELTRAAGWQTPALSLEAHAAASAVSKYAGDDGLAGLKTAFESALAAFKSDGSDAAKTTLARAAQAYELGIESLQAGVLSGSAEGKALAAEQAKWSGTSGTKAAIDGLKATADETIKTNIYEKKFGSSDNVMTLEEIRKAAVALKTAINTGGSLANDWSSFESENGSTNNSSALKTAIEEVATAVTQEGLATLDATTGITAANGAKWKAVLAGINGLTHSADLKTPYTSGETTYSEHVTAAKLSQAISGDAEDTTSWTKFITAVTEAKKIDASTSFNDASDTTFKYGGAVDDYLKIAANAELAAKVQFLPNDHATNPGAVSIDGTAAVNATEGVLNTTGGSAGQWTTLSANLQQRMGVPATPDAITANTYATVLTGVNTKAGALKTLADTTAANGAASTFDASTTAAKDKIAQLKFDQAAIKTAIEGAGLKLSDLGAEPGKVPAGKDLPAPKPTVSAQTQEMAANNNIPTLSDADKTPLGASPDASKLPGVKEELDKALGKYAAKKDAGLLTNSDRRELALAAQKYQAGLDQLMDAAEADAKAAVAKAAEGGKAAEWVKAAQTAAATKATEALGADFGVANASTSAKLTAAKMIEAAGKIYEKLAAGRDGDAGKLANNWTGKDDFIKQIKAISELKTTGITEANAAQVLADVKKAFAGLNFDNVAGDGTGDAPTAEDFEAAIGDGTKWASFTNAVKDVGAQVAKTDAGSLGSVISAVETVKKVAEAIALKADGTGLESASDLAAGTDIAAAHAALAPAGVTAPSVSDVNSARGAVKTAQQTLEAVQAIRRDPSSVKIGDGDVSSDDPLARMKGALALSKAVAEEVEAKSGLTVGQLGAVSGNLGKLVGTPAPLPQDPNEKYEPFDGPARGEPAAPTGSVGDELLEVLDDFPAADRAGVDALVGSDLGGGNKIAAGSGEQLLDLDGALGAKDVTITGTKLMKKLADAGVADVIKHDAADFMARTLAAAVGENTDGLLEPLADLRLANSIGGAWQHPETPKTVTSATNLEDLRAAVQAWRDGIAGLPDAGGDVQTTKAVRAPDAGTADLDALDDAPLDDEHEDAVTAARHMLQKMDALAQLDGWLAAIDAVDDKLADIAADREVNGKSLADIIGLNDENSVNFGRLSLVGQGAKDIQLVITDASGNDMTKAAGFDRAVNEKTVSLRETNAKTERDVAAAQGFNAEDWMDGELNDENRNGYPAGVMTFKGAQAMIDIAETAQKALEAIRSDLGSVQNQLVVTVNNISVTQVNVKAAESNIRDVDFAQESATFSKHQILAQSGVYAMSQANAVQQNVMRLLQ